MRLRPLPPGLVSFVLLLPFFLPVQPRSVPNGAGPALERRRLRSFFGFGRSEELTEASHEASPQANPATEGWNFFGFAPLDTNPGHERDDRFSSETSATSSTAQASSQTAGASLTTAEPDPNVNWPTFYTNREKHLSGLPEVEEVAKHVVHEDRSVPSSFRPVDEETRASTSSSFAGEPQLHSASSSSSREHRYETASWRDANQYLGPGRSSSFAREPQFPPASSRSSREHQYGTASWWDANQYLDPGRSSAAGRRRSRPRPRRPRSSRE